MGSQVWEKFWDDWVRGVDCGEELMILDQAQIHWFWKVQSSTHQLRPSLAAPNTLRGGRGDWREIKGESQVSRLIISASKALIVKTGGSSIIFSFIRQRADTFISIRLGKMVIDRPKFFFSSTWWKWPRIKWQSENSERERGREVGKSKDSMDWAQCWSVAVDEGHQAIWLFEWGSWWRRDDGSKVRRQALFMGSLLLDIKMRMGESEKGLKSLSSRGREREVQYSKYLNSWLASGLLVETNQMKILTFSKHFLQSRLWVLGSVDEVEECGGSYYPDSVSGNPRLQDIERRKMRTTCFWKYCNRKHIAKALQML